VQSAKVPASHPHRFALTAVSNMRRAVTLRQRECCGKATKALLMSPK
jgi:hypothetical protein